MSNVAQRIREIAAQDAFLRVPLARGILSYSKTIDWIKEHHGLEDVKDATIRSALQRHHTALAAQALEPGESTLEGGRVNVDSDLVIVVLERTERARQKLCDVYKELDLARGETLKIVPGDEKILVAVRVKMLETVEDILGLKGSEPTFEDVTTLQVIPPEDHDGRGAIWEIVATLRARGIDPVFFLSSYPDHYVVVSREAGDRAHRALEALTAES